MTGADTKIQSIGIIGAGAWGTALASIAARAGRDVTLWAYEPEVADAINTRHENSVYLPGIALDENIRATTDHEAVAKADVVLLVCPAQTLRSVTTQLADRIRPGTPVAICAKGIEQSTGKLMTQVLEETTPHAIPAVLSGPSFAADVARGLPTAVTLACADEDVGTALVDAIGIQTFRPYQAADLVGAEIGGSVKNVLAIACGIVEGKKLGASAAAALTARGFAELTRLGVALGARAETLGGLSGLGDLILTCGSLQSRNMSLGAALGEGRPLAEILGERVSVAEGVATAPAVVALARKHGVEMPICEAVASVVTGTATVDDAITALLSRPFRRES
ncbi:Glycerol-3-phosphate dehydrogenase [NAD(P)+] (EC 1.1.1.94) [Candidatus Phaeomarinobacter ectocarpi]|uniref:Glycerol-3-phosphate dehydrogenase [NAD(P)+] n=1 Tax=Candidatus Phaeomarinibacter ectocarpi TaxID=1458461 RepID=X5MLN7_9HYPH|nr:NAD(P)H-dependent glycerol-3-phosphate dehydrogenase [Candidatus Phaeomarinobacter ectocarpi]CDO59640.1 Glycerol-3-phosphate dehydrogenase [NAD(P)+] (EC 1.1.1.94) [Candidatus Phaeomarinobacter ectocarpi]